MTVFEAYITNLGKAKSRQPTIPEQMKQAEQQLAKEKPPKEHIKEVSHDKISSENMCCPTFPMCSSAGCSSSWGRPTVWRQAAILPISLSAWDRPSAWPLPPLPPALPPLTGWWALWGQWRSVC